MLDLVAKKLFLTKGIGIADDKLTSFEFALRNAGIAGTNIVCFVEASMVVNARSSALPSANLAMVFAVAGKYKITSHHLDNEM